MRTETEGQVQSLRSLKREREILFFKGAFLMWLILKVFIKFATVSFLVYVLSFRHAGSQLPEQGSNVHPLP